MSHLTLSTKRTDLIVVQFLRTQSTNYHITLHLDHTLARRTVCSTEIPVNLENYNPGEVWSKIALFASDHGLKLLDSANQETNFAATLESFKVYADKEKQKHTHGGPMAKAL